MQPCVKQNTVESLIYIFFCVFESGVLYENCIRRERVYSTLFLSRFFLFVGLFFIILKKSCSFCIKARIRLRGRDASKRIMSVKRVRTKWDESKVKHMNVLLFHCARYSLKKSTCSGYVVFLLGA